ncbi:uncharacterized protein V1518DRAFT_45484 [Limtongia smithiae]|uniref:uncharacterized protein n=1 Tax=Limtongia smithiae TaxID=1125753 RepID=UPI0034CD8594
MIHLVSAVTMNQLHTSVEIPGVCGMIAVEDPIVREIQELKSSTNSTSAPRILATALCVSMTNRTACHLLILPTTPTEYVCDVEYEPIADSFSDNKLSNITAKNRLPGLPKTSDSQCVLIESYDFVSTLESSCRSAWNRIQHMRPHGNKTKYLKDLASPLGFLILIFLLELVRRLDLILFYLLMHLMRRYLAPAKTWRKKSSAVVYYL